jgi:hypothetical protein
MIRINCDGPIQEDTGSSFCPVKPDVDEYDCEVCREYQAQLATYENDHSGEIDTLRQLEGKIWGDNGNTSGST